jgi:hypothetical protein
MAGILDTSMPSFTLITRDREYRLERTETLRELLARRLISPADRVLAEGAEETIAVSDVLERLEAGASLESAIQSGTRGGQPDRADVGRGGDPWRAWDTDENVEVDDLVSQLLDDASTPGNRPEAGGPAFEADTDLWLNQLSQAQNPAVPAPGTDTSDGDIPSIPEESIEMLGAIPETVKLPRPVPRGVRAERPADADTELGSSGAYPPVSGSYAPVSGSQPAVSDTSPQVSGSYAPVSDPYRAVPGGGAGQGAPVPRSFVEFVQQKRGANTALEIHEDKVPLVPGEDRRRRPAFFWPVVVGLLAGLGAVMTYGVVRTGAERQYPAESEVRARLQASPGDLATVSEDVDAEPTTSPDGVPEADTDAFRESRLRSEIPAPLREFRNVETFQDALFTDLANSGVLVREIRVEPLVVAPLPDQHRQRPEEANLELWIQGGDDEAGSDAALKTALVIGHYAAHAHIRIQELVIHVVSEGEVWATFLTRGTSAAAFWEAKLDVQAFMRNVDRVADGEYIDEATE